MPPRLGFVELKPRGHIKCSPFAWGPRGLRPLRNPLMPALRAAASRFLGWFGVALAASCAVTTCRRCARLLRSTCRSGWLARLLALSTLAGAARGWLAVLAVGRGGSRGLLGGPHF